MYEVREPFWQFVDHWQTLITGLLALGAGVGTVWATIKSASREIEAARAQTAAAQHQTAVTREIERRRIAREGYAFHAMLEAAMAAVIDDLTAARKLPQPPPRSTDYSIDAYLVRRRVKRAGFAELRGAFLRFGGPIFAQFLQIDKEIEDFSGRITPTQSTYGYPSGHLGADEGLTEQLDRIEQIAISLRHDAAGGMELCRDELAKELVEEKVGEKGAPLSNHLKPVRAPLAGESSRQRAWRRWRETARIFKARQ